MYPYLYKMDTFGYIKIPKKSQLKYSCINCDYYTSNKRDFNKHILTPKHQRIHLDTLKSPKNPQNPKTYICSNCNKTYKYHTGLSKHKKKCQITILPQEDLVIEVDNSKEIMSLLIQQQKVQNEMIQEQNKIIQQHAEQSNINEQLLINNTTNNITNNNTQNNHFNLNLFLNEQCKNAMNITDFIKSIEIEIEDVANVGKLGYVEGITRIFTKALNNLDVYERPIHCSDLKREVMYVKDNGIWEKEGEDKTSMKKALEVISHKNVMKIKGWTDANPSWKTHYSKEEDEYLKISYESMGGSNKEEDNKYFNKIIRKVASNVIIDKNNNNKKYIYSIS
jgi:hypothetical protein